MNDIPELNEDEERLFNAVRLAALHNLELEDNEGKSERSINLKKDIIKFLKGED